MGNFEKLVVLTVLFLAAIILGVSLHDDSSGRPDGPLDQGPPAGPERTAVADPAPSEAAANRAALSSLVETPPVGPATIQPKVEPKTQPEATPSQPEVESLVDSPKRSLLLTTAGLSKPAFGDETMTYPWREGDTITALSVRYYGDSKLRYLIRNYNEGAEYRPGDLINLPLYDTAADAGSRPAYEPAPAHEAPKVKVEPARTVQTYLVEDGDSLWKIAVAAYGKGTNWELIFKANRDLLDDPSDLKPGMTLRLP